MVTILCSCKKIRMYNDNNIVPVRKIMTVAVGIIILRTIMVKTMVAVTTLTQYHLSISGEIIY